MGAIHHNQFTEELYKIVPKGMYLRDNSISYSDDKTERVYRLYNKRHQEVVSFRARALPGCCGVLVVFYLRPAPGKQRVEAFMRTLAWIRDAAGKAKFGSIMLTQTHGSLGYDAIIQQSATDDDSPEWEITDFTNWKTKNKVCIFTAPTIKPPEEVKSPTFEGE